MACPPNYSRLRIISEAGRGRRDDESPPGRCRGLASQTFFTETLVRAGAPFIGRGLFFTFSSIIIITMTIISGSTNAKAGGGSRASVWTVRGGPSRLQMPLRELIRTRTARVKRTWTHSISSTVRGRGRRNRLWIGPNVSTAVGTTLAIAGPFVARTSILGAIRLPMNLMSGMWRCVTM